MSSSPFIFHPLCSEWPLPSSHSPSEKLMIKAQLFRSFLALTFLTVLLSSASYIQAQQPNNTPQSIKGVREQLAGSRGASEREATVNFAAMAAEQKLAPTGLREGEEKEIDKPKPGPLNRPVPDDAGVQSGAAYNFPATSSVVSGLTETTVTNSPPAASSFKALAYYNTTISPATHGAVGPNHLMVTLNSEVRIQTR